MEEAGRRYGRQTRVASAAVIRAIEFWIHNAPMLDMLTAEMQKEYQGNVTIPNWGFRRCSGSRPTIEPTEGAEAA